MKYLAIALFLVVCTSASANSTCRYPEKASTSADLFKSFPATCLSDTLIKMVRDEPESLEFWFLKSSPDDRAPVQVGIYRRSGDTLALAYQAALPVPADACRSGNCKIDRITGIAKRPDGKGFQLSIENNTGDFFVTRYQFLWHENDLQLVLKIQSVGTTASGPKMRCAREWKYLDAERVNTFGTKQSTVPLTAQESVAKFLLKDKLTFEQPERALLCSSR